MLGIAVELVFIGAPGGAPIFLPETSGAGVLTLKSWIPPIDSGTLNDTLIPL